MRASTRGRAAPRLAAGAAALLAAACAAGCGSSGHATPASLRLQREDLVAVSHALQQAEGQVRSETAATRAAWPLVANGLPSRPSAAATAKIAAAARDAQALAPPALFGELRAAQLTGPAAGIAGTFHTYVALSARGWQMLGYALTLGEGSAAAAFARANAGLYIESVYDGHFGLAQVGKKLLAGWEKLGGASAFGASLPHSEVQRLEGLYSERTLRLHPHDAVKLGS